MFIVRFLFFIRELYQNLAIDLIAKKTDTDKIHAITMFIFLEFNVEINFHARVSNESRLPGQFFDFAFKSLRVAVSVGQVDQYDLIHLFQVVSLQEVLCRVNAHVRVNDAVANYCRDMAGQNLLIEYVQGVVCFNNDLVQPQEAIRQIMRVGSEKAKTHFIVFNQEAKRLHIVNDFQRLDPEFTQVESLFVCHVFRSVALNPGFSVFADVLEMIPMSMRGNQSRNPCKIKVQRDLCFLQVNASLYDEALTFAVQDVAISAAV